MWELFCQKYRDCAIKELHWKLGELRFFQSKSIIFLPEEYRWDCDCWTQPDLRDPTKKLWEHLHLYFNSRLNM